MERMQSKEVCEYGAGGLLTSNASALLEITRSASPESLTEYHQHIQHLHTDDELSSCR